MNDFDDQEVHRDPSDRKAVCEDLYERLLFAMWSDFAVSLREQWEEKGWWSDKQIDAALKILNRPQPIPCRRCGQMLYDPESIEREYGSYCWSVVR